MNMPDPITSFDILYQRLDNMLPLSIVVAAADDDSVLSALNMALERGWITPVLVGEADRIKFEMEKQKLDEAQFEIIDTPRNLSAAKAVELVRSGNADLIMKGKTTTAELLKAVLNPDNGLQLRAPLEKKEDASSAKTSILRLLSHVAVVESLEYQRLLVCTDGGVNIDQSLPVLRDVLRNALDLSRALNIVMPHVAALALVEKVTEKLPETRIAQTLAQEAGQGAYGRCVVEGPLALDVALSREAADMKDITSRVAGKADILLGPNITTINFMVKALMSIGKTRGGGLVLGALAPIVLLSRSDSPDTRLNSIALALAASLYYSQHPSFGNSRQLAMEL